MTHSMKCIACAHHLDEHLPHVRRRDEQCRNCPCEGFRAYIEPKVWSAWRDTTKAELRKRQPLSYAHILRRRLAALDRLIDRESHAA
jgi:hypothetical protein